MGPDSRAAEVRRRNHVMDSATSAQPMLFAHGFGCDQNMWRFVTPAFAADYRIVTFDYAGHGGSDRSSYDPARYASLNGFADDILDIVHALDLRDVILVAHSVSSMIGVLAINRAPDRFSQLVMVGPSPRYINDPPDYVGGFERTDIEGLLDMMDKNYIGWADACPHHREESRSPRAERGASDRSFCSTDPLIARQFAKVTFLSDNRDDLPRLPVPSVVLQCSEDAIAPIQVGEYVARVTPGAAFRQLAATGHCPHLSHPAETIAAIRDYVAGAIDA